MIDSFTNTLYFGTFLKKKKNLRCTVTNMLLLGVIDIDGKINISNIDKSDKGDLWVYLYYIWSNNRYVGVFSQEIVSRLSGSNLIRFVKSRSDSGYYFIKKRDIAEVCNDLLSISDIHVPIINETLVVLEKLFTKQEESLQMKLRGMSHGLTLISSEQ
jgi:hypothetical protein